MITRTPHKDVMSISIEQFSRIVFFYYYYYWQEQVDTFTIRWPRVTRKKIEL